MRVPPDGRPAPDLDQLDGENSGDEED